MTHTFLDAARRQTIFLALAAETRPANIAKFDRNGCVRTFYPCREFSFSPGKNADVEFNLLRIRFLKIRLVTPQPQTSTIIVRAPRNVGDGNAAHGSACSKGLRRISLVQRVILM